MIVRGFVVVGIVGVEGIKLKRGMRGKGKRLVKERGLRECG